LDFAVSEFLVLRISSCASQIKSSVSSSFWSVHLFGENLISFVNGCFCSHTPKRIELLSVDGQACRHLEGSQSANPASSKWISPAERYAVVPDETLGSIAPQLHQVTHVDITQLSISFLLPQTPNNTLPFYQSFVFISLKGFF
jgi:hypothetical protein